MSYILSYDCDTEIAFHVKFNLDKLIFLSSFRSKNGMIEISKFEEFIWEIFKPSTIRVSLNWIIISPVGLIDFTEADKFLGKFMLSGTYLFFITV